MFSRFFKEGVEPLKIDLSTDKDILDQAGPLVAEMIFGGGMGSLADDVLEGGLKVGRAADDFYDVSRFTKSPVGTGTVRRMPSYAKQRGFIRIPDVPKYIAKAREILARGKEGAQPAFLRRTDAVLDQGGGAIGSGRELTPRLTELRELHRAAGTYTDEGIRVFDAKDLAGHGGNTPTGWKMHINPKDTIDGVDTRKWLHQNFGPEQSWSSKYVYKYQTGNKGITIYGKDGLAFSYDDMIDVGKELETKIGKSNIRPGQDITKRWIHRWP